MFCIDSIAIAQIKRKQYLVNVAQYTDNLLFAWIAYEREAKEHRCWIERGGVMLLDAFICILAIFLIVIHLTAFSVMVGEVKTGIVEMIEKLSCPVMVSE